MQCNNDSNKENTRIIILLTLLFITVLSFVIITIIIWQNGVKSINEKCITCCILNCPNDPTCTDDCYDICIIEEIYRELCFSHPNMTIIE